VPMADSDGNIWVGRRHEFSTMARGAHRTLVTYERLYDGDMRADATLAPGVVPALYVTALSHQPRGAWPLHMGKDYPEDSENMREYARLSPTDEGFREYLDRYVLGIREAA